MPLVDTGLVCRYYFDAAASGTAPTQVDDTSGNAYHLTEINYGSGNLAWTEVSGNRGLESTATSGTQRARRSIDNTSDALRDALAGTAVVTFELVLDVQTGNASTARVLAINDRVGGSPVLGVAATNTSFRFYWNGAAMNDIGLTTGRHVLHFVIDTTLGSNQYKLYIDGTNTNNNSTSGTLTIGSNVDLIAFNRESSGSFDRSYDGVLYYAAIYDAALSDTEISDNYDILTLDDDAPAGGGGTVNTEVLEDTIAVTDERVSWMFRNRLLTDTLLVTEGSTVVSTIHGLIFSDEIVVSDASAQFFVRTRIAQSGIVVTDELLASIIGNAILTRVLSDDIVVTDGTIWSAIRGRFLQDTITISEGATEVYTTTNLVATDEVLLDDSMVPLRWLTRLLTDDINLTDEAIAAIVGQNVLTRLLTDTIETVDEAVAWCHRHRVGESVILATDEIVKVMRWTRELTDSIELADENLTALQRFIMLSDALTVSDSAIASVNPTPDDFVTPTIRIGYDQPRIVIGGYAVN